MITLFQIILYGKECDTRMINLYEMIIVLMHPLITLSRSITILCGIDNNMKNIPPFKPNVRNILQNIANPTKHYYEYE